MNAEQMLLNNQNNRRAKSINLMKINCKKSNGYVSRKMYVDKLIEHDYQSIEMHRNVE